jgi:hypothetical protein
MVYNDVTIMMKSMGRHNDLDFGYIANVLQPHEIGNEN